MAHVFSVEIHDFLSRKILQAENGVERAKRENDEDNCRYHEGQLLELATLRSYLSDNIDLKTQKYY